MASPPPRAIGRLPVQAYMSVKLDRAAVDSVFYRLRQKPDDVGARGELLRLLRPVIEVYAEPCSLTEATVIRTVGAAEQALLGRLDLIIPYWHRLKHPERRLLAIVRRAVELVVVQARPGGLARVIEDDLKLEPLQVLRQRGNERALVGILAATLAKARQHFDAGRGRRYLRLAEKCVYALIHGNRPSWSSAATQAWGRHRYGDVREIYSMCQQWTREVLADYILKEYGAKP